jgi:hypothetical protein
MLDGCNGGPTRRLSSTGIVRNARAPESPGEKERQKFKSIGQSFRASVQHVPVLSAGCMRTAVLSAVGILTTVRVSC